jgi:hypothetical protein
MTSLTSANDIDKTAEKRHKSHMNHPITNTVEYQRLLASKERTADWKNWGPYVSDRAWGTVREDYSPHGSAWEFFPHDHARSRVYRWNEDGLAGV